MARVELNTPAPEFKLIDYTGQQISLSAYKGKQPILLVFNRGFFWPFCRAHMAQLRQDFDQFVAKDTAVLVIGPDDENQFKEYFTKHNLPFIGIPDPKHSVLKLYGQQVKIFKFGRMPAQLLIDKEGIVRFVHYGHNMQDIPKTEEMLALIDQL